MARDFTPAFPYSTPIELLIPTYTSKKGVPVKTFTNKGARLNCSFKTYGGTETTENDLYSVIDTAVIETWFRPDIKADCRIKVLQTGVIYEVISPPENINMRNQFVKFKVQAVKGGA
jgi:SPP1 family predicted phage head-tail adaptor